METKGFYTLQFFDCLVDAVIGSVYCITEDEAANLGILLEETWELLSLWRYDAEEYGRAVANKPGATWSILNEVGTTTTTTTTTITEKAATDTTTDAATTNNKEPTLYSMTHPQFITLYNRWHAQLGTTFIGGLRSSEYMHTRISLVLLTRIVRHFPTKSKLGEKISTVLQPLQSDSNLMQDIRTMAQGYESHLSKIQWKEEDSKVARERLEKEEKEKKRREIDLKEKFKEMQQQPAAQPPSRPGNRRGIKWTPADPSPHAQRSDSRTRPTSSNDKKTETAGGPLASRWERSERSGTGGGNGTSDQNNSNNRELTSSGKKRQRSPSSGGGGGETDRGGGDSKRNRAGRNSRRR